MSDPVYNWKDQHQRGTNFEQVLDKHYRSRYRIVPAKDLDQRRGIDRYFMEQILHGPPGCETGWDNWFTVEYKADEKLALTKRIFIETEQQKGERAILGWAQRIMAQVLIVYSPQQGKAWWANVWTIKEYMYDWLQTHPQSRWCENTDGRRARGVLVPASEFINNCCFREDTIDGE